MIAIEGDEIIGVCIGCKRAKETLIYKIGVHPAHLRNGHGRHILQSLRQKFSVLGPPRLVVEVPTNLSGVCAFFSSLGYKSCGTLYDYHLPSISPRTEHQELLSEITWDDVTRHKLLPSEAGSWVRANDSLESIKDKIKGVAIVSSENIEAYLFYREEADQVTLLRFWWRQNNNLGHEQQLAFTSLMLSTLKTHQQQSILIPKISSEEISLEVLEKVGFLRTAEYVRYSIKAEESTMP